jgi:hypothetical protein
MWALEAAKPGSILAVGRVWMLPGLNQKAGVEESRCRRALEGGGQYIQLACRHSVELCREYERERQLFLRHGVTSMVLL